MEILPFLFLGSALHASKKDMLDRMGISALLNVSSNCPNHFEGDYQYKCIPVEDNHKEDISSWFIEAIEFIGKMILYLFFIKNNIYIYNLFYVCMYVCKLGFGWLG